MVGVAIGGNNSERFYKKSRPLSGAICKEDRERPREFDFESVKEKLMKSALRGSLLANKDARRVTRLCSDS